MTEVQSDNMNLKGVDFMCVSVREREKECVCWGVGGGQIHGSMKTGIKSKKTHLL